MNFAVFIIIALLSFSANAGPAKKDISVKSKIIHSSLGEFKFVLLNLENRPYSKDTNRAEIQISSPDGQQIQKIPVEISFSSPAFEFFDVNDDGYVDLLVYTYEIPNGSIPVPDVYLYIPKLMKFVKSKTLSAKGEISKSKQHGCVNIIFERNVEGYIAEEWCFSLDTGRWKMVNKNEVTLGQ